MVLRKGKRIHSALEETVEDETLKRLCVESESDDFDSIAEESDSESEFESHFESYTRIDTIESSLNGILEAFSTIRDVDTGKEFSWDYFQDQISKHPEQVTPLLFHQILMISCPVVPLEVVTEIMSANPNVVTGEAIKFLATMPWISSKHVHHIISLEESYITFSEDSGTIDEAIESVASKWLKVFDTLQHEDLPPPRLQVTGMILMWLIPELIEHHDPEIIFSRYLLFMTSYHSKNIQYLLQVLEIFMICFIAIEDVETQCSCHESFLRAVCDSVILRIISDWSDKDAELGLRTIFKLVQMTEYGIARITNSTALNISFTESKFETAKFLMLSCPCSVLGADPYSEKEGQSSYNPHSDSRPNIMQILAKDDNPKQRLILVQCFVEKYISLTLNLELNLSHWYGEIGTHKVFECGGLFIISYSHYLREQRRKYQAPASILNTDYNEESDDFFCGLIHFLLEFNKTNSKGLKGNETLDLRIEWHLMSIVRFFIEYRKWDLIDWAVKEYPIILLAQSRLVGMSDKKSKGTILHLLGHSSKAPASLIQTLIHQGVSYGIDRGGLLIKNELDEIPLELICKKKGREIMRLFPFLLNAQNPKLITETDLKERFLFHAISRGGQCAFAMKLLKMYPNVLDTVDDRERLPIHYVLDPLSSSNPSFLRLLLKEGLKQGVGGKGGMAGLLTKDNQGLTPLDLLVKREPDGKSALVKVLFEGIVSNPPLISSLLLQPMLHRPKPENIYHRDTRFLSGEMARWIWSRDQYDEKLLSILSKYKKSGSIPDTNGRLPIHIAIEKCLGEMGTELNLYSFGRSFNGSGISGAAKAYLVLRNDSSCLLCIDPKTGLYPFQMVASKEELRGSDPDARPKRITLLSEIFTMLRLEPAVVFG